MLLTSFMVYVILLIEKSASLTIKIKIMEKLKSSLEYLFVFLAWIGAVANILLLSLALAVMMQFFSEPHNFDAEKLLRLGFYLSQRPFLLVVMTMVLLYSNYFLLGFYIGKKIK